MLITCKCLNISLNILKNNDLSTTTKITAINSDPITVAAAADTVSGSSNSKNVLPVTYIGPPINNEQQTIYLEHLSHQQQQQQLKQQQQQHQQLQNKLKDDYLQFVKESYGPATVVGMNKKLTDFVLVYPMDQWNINQCLNCNTITHAECEQQFFINSSLMTNQEEINFKMASEQYSKTYGIIVNPKFNDEFKIDKILLSNDPSVNVFYENKIKNLSQIVKNEMQRELDATEERTRRYEEQQLALFKVAREKADQECHILTSLLKTVPDWVASSGGNISNNNNNNNSNNMETDAFGLQLSTTNNTLETPPPTPDSTPMSIGNSPNFKPTTASVIMTTPTITTNNNPSLLNNKTSVTPNTMNNSSKLSTSLHHSRSNPLNIKKNILDDECIFELDGVDDDRTPHNMSDDDGDNDDSDSDDDDDDFEDDDDADGDFPVSNRHIDVDGAGGAAVSGSVLITRQISRTKSITMPQSLPISMPIGPGRQVDINDYNECVEDDNIDIAASIKALAKSVHGDAIFGDLPRPRFSTKI